MENSDKLEMLKDQRKVSELEQQGYRFIKVPRFNRKVNLRHVKDLMANVRQCGSFLKTMQVISAVEWFKFYPDREITLDSGEVITKDSEGLDKIFFILDGQHRYEADNELGIEEGYVSTLTAELVNLPDGMSPDEWMTSVNSTSQNWNEKDRASYIIALNPDEETNVSIAEQWYKDYAMSMRCSFGLLNYADNYRKSYHIEYMRNPEKGLPQILKGTVENRKRGIATLHAIEVGFRNNPKVIRNMSVVEFVIEAYSEAPDKDKATTVENIKTFLMSLSGDIAANVSASRDKGERKRILREAWGKFQKAMKRADRRKELTCIAQNAESEWEKMMTAKEASKKNR